MSMFVYHRLTRAWHRRWYRGCIFMSSGHDGHRISCLSPLWSADNITRQVRNTQITSHTHTHTHTHKNTQIHNSSQERKYEPLVWLKCVWINATSRSTTKHWAARYPQLIKWPKCHHFFGSCFFVKNDLNHFELLGMFLGHMYRVTQKMSHIDFVARTAWVV